MEKGLQTFVIPPVHSPACDRYFLLAGAVGCLWKWNRIEKGRPLTKDEIGFVVGLVMGWIDEQIRQLNEKILCVNPCVKKVPKLAKMCKINKNVEFIYLMLSVCYCKMRRLGNSEGLSSNP